MERSSGKRNTKKLAALKAGTKTADGGGLYAVAGSEGRATWGFLFTINRRRRLMSLGKWPDVSLAAARDLATDARRKKLEHQAVDLAALDALELLADQPMMAPRAITREPVLGEPDDRFALALKRFEA